MQVPIELHNKRLVCKTVKRHFDSAEVMFFSISSLFLSRSTKEDTERKAGGKKTEKG